MIGLSKTGLGGCGVLAVALFAQVVPARASTGLVLPLLICADIVAVTAFRRHAVWTHVLRMFPPTALGILIGYLALKTRYLHSDNSVKMLIGGIVTALVLFTVARRAWQAKQPVVETGPTTQSWPTVIAAGLLAGFLTMVANSSGPVMTLYLLAIGLPKMEFIGTGAYFFLCLNLFKVPFSASLGFLTGGSLTFDLVLAPIAVGGALWGKWLISFLNQRRFEDLSLAFALLSGLNLLISPLLGHR
jgi:uncharacterized membrane protein YfcA